jgi:uncharacterized protein YecT (DUF1311 family)
MITPKGGSMRVLVTLLFLGVRPAPFFAQISEEYRKCDSTANSQFEMNACASDEAARNDAELNREYRKLLAIAEKEQNSLEKIKSMERTWIAYRDAYMDAMFPAKDKQAEYGSMFPMEADIVRAKLTQQQIAALKELQKQCSHSEP